jgi:hypothetical protein
MLGKSEQIGDLIVRNELAYLNLIYKKWEWGKTAVDAPPGLVDWLAHFVSTLEAGDGDQVDDSKVT